MRSLLAALFTLLFATAPASATIRILDSRLEGGTLIVSGQAKPNAEVTLDRKFSTKADGGGHFEFHEKYRPASCLANIGSGEDSYSAVVTNCLLEDAAAAGLRK